MTNEADEQRLTALLERLRERCAETAENIIVSEFEGVDYYGDKAAEAIRKIELDVAVREFAAALSQRPAEPFWYAVVSRKDPVVNKAVRRADVAEEYAQRCRANGYTGVEVVPLYTASEVRRERDGGDTAEGGKG